MKRRGFFAALAALVASPFVAAAKPDPLEQLVETAKALDAAPVPEVNRMLWSNDHWTDGLARTFHANQSAYNALSKDYLDNLWLANNPVIVVDPDKLASDDWPTLPGKVVRVEPQG